MASITGNNILKFVYKDIVCRFGIPRTIISDNGKQFAENLFKSWCEGLRITQRFTSVYHPQANGQTEVTNRTLRSTSSPMFYGPTAPLPESERMNLHFPWSMVQKQSSQPKSACPRIAFFIF